MRFASGLSARALIVAALVLACGGAALGHETDQYTPPVGRDFADLGMYFSRIFRTAIEEAVAETNAAILAPAPLEDPAAMPTPDPLSADYVAGQVWKHLFMALPVNEGLDAQLASAPLRAQFPGLVTLHWPVHPVYNDPLLLLDPTKPVRALFRAGTVSVGGTLIGTDKIIHFINLGRIYHSAYLDRVRLGVPQAQAKAQAVASVNANPLLSEDGMLGYLTTGIRSNGDLAANFAGLEFYRNLTEAVRIGSRLLPPMLVKDGPIWRFAVPPDADFFASFVTPHWNEVLNPNTYLDYFADRMRTLIRERCPAVLEANLGAQGQVLDERDFEAAERWLSTYFGEPYGHTGSGGVSVAGVCFPQDAASTAEAARPPAAPPAGNRLERTTLWWAARSGDAAGVAGSIALGADPNGADADGETPLHAAVRSGDLQAVQVLLAHGADPNRGSLVGETALMLAAETGQAGIALCLLRAGANPVLRGPFGMSALHDAVLRDSAELAELLVRSGADPNLPDDAGNTALHLAGGAGSDAIAEALLRHGAVITVRNASGQTPVDLAQRRGHARTADYLASQATDKAHTALVSSAAAADRESNRSAPANPARRLDDAK